MPSTFARSIALAALMVALVVARPAVAGQPAQIHKASVDVHGAPDSKSAVVATLKQGAAVDVGGQQGLWYRVSLPSGPSGFVRVNEVRMAYGKSASSSDVGGLFAGRAGKGRVSETAGVRGLDESDLRAASFDGAQLAKMESYRETPQQAADAMRRANLRERSIPYKPEEQAVAANKKGGATQQQKRSGLSAARGLLSSLGLGNAASDTALGAADATTRKSGEELTEEELQLGPEIAGRILGAAPLWQDDAAQRRVNRVGRWLASHTARPELPWTFGVIDSPEINAFAAPGGYVLVTRGIYELVDANDDQELAGVLAHELSHVVQRDHYEVIHKQEMQSYGKDVALSHVSVGGGELGNVAKDYLAKNGAAVMLTSLDRGAEYRSDEAAEVYLARSGYDPLALYAVLQKMTALGSKAPAMAQLFRTHPPLDERLDRLDHNKIAMGD
ncbi:M48 family metalloprotease [Pseudoluteimonas lycopersici]|uniref:M48 family metalloprotease n=1 Tax=Pseudoluteimonas lycopersici TaxID=1324796 RepID=A0A516V434_9GAMM|nr:M48 family metalloprotease [Lysobacter lycopersici]QDQ73286.1 M48 family metalloprotease [Lysobacter lycopersici]